MLVSKKPVMKSSAQRTVYDVTAIAEIEDAFCARRRQRAAVLEIAPPSAAGLAQAFEQCFFAGSVRPMRPSTSPGRMEKDTSLSAVRCPYRFVRFETCSKGLNLWG
jgi:hypothetical protein